MICQKCRKSVATTRYAEVVDGKVTELNLCEECLRDHQGDATTGFGLSQSSAVRRRPSHAPDRTHKACKTCGLTLETVVETGYVGCAQCYTLFSEALTPMLEELHGASTHNGASPRINSERARVGADLQTKRGLLRDALMLENYEEAALLRDEIRVLENLLAGSNSGGN